MQALKFALVSALALIGLSVLVKAGGYGGYNNWAHSQVYYQQPQVAYQQVAYAQPVQYAAVPVGGYGYGYGGGIGYGGGLGFGGGGGGLIWLIIVIVVILAVLGLDNN